MQFMKPQNGNFGGNLQKCKSGRICKKAGRMVKCIEARELIIALPESFTEYQPDRLLQLFYKSFLNRIMEQSVLLLCTTIKERPIITFI